MNSPAVRQKLTDALAEPMSPFNKYEIEWAVEVLEPVVNGIVADKLVEAAHFLRDLHGYSGATSAADLEILAARMREKSDYA